MANRILYLNPVNDSQFEIDFSVLITLIKGSSITSAALADDFFEIGLSDAFNLRVDRSAIYLMSTLNKGERPPIRLRIMGEGEAHTAGEIERRIHSLRQVYATAFLVNTGRSAKVARILEENPQADLEELLSNKDRLFVTAASEGTFWLTVITRTKAAFRSLTAIVPLFYDEGRQALLDRVRAATELQRLGVEEKRMQLTFEQANKLIDLVQKIDKIKDPAIRERVRDSLSSNIGALGNASVSLPKPGDEPE